MIRTLAAALALAAAPLALAQRDADAASTYRIETTGTTQQLRVGQKGKLVLSIVPIGKVHVDPRAPLKVTLTSTPGVTLEKTTLGKEDPVDPAAPGRRFEVPFVATRAGRNEARAKLEFFVCSDQWCVKQVRDVTFPLDVR